MEPAKWFWATQTKHHDLFSDLNRGSVGLFSRCVHILHYVLANAQPERNRHQHNSILTERQREKERAKKDAKRTKMSSSGGFWQRHGCFSDGSQSSWLKRGLESTAWMEKQRWGRGLDHPPHCTALLYRTWWKLITNKTDRKVEALPSCMVHKLVAPMTMADLSLKYFQM